ncbi:Brp/Blh family beta-carotene 15,15'-dioxygenase [Halomicroarcula sp. S1AR25-4]|uniref:Brp/Blh family beta-carotene 15,15'-dioxygenase n=1 Tax=Haloarcula sp. S1AR25-4 TaxID=2950538 RepID=UPI002874EC96|nr:Brp/Blh family beta-carotene 15,15'-dioxygenase [Halomicroarcula sp. S1AR25-4]MDS0277702.1 Brp/Blh family beta-carotene 15,15'-dioxygenase [Halomicroarcula sp. S1AR25-4]
MGVTDRLAAPARETIRRTVFLPSWVASAALAVPFLAGLSVPPTLQYVPLVASVLVLGLPHGAVDHLAVARSRGERPDWRAIARVFALYGLVGGAYAVGWFLTPAAAFVLFIAVTWFHWGQGDLYALRALADADHLRSVPQRAATVIVRGGLPMLVPLLAFPGWYRRVAVDLVALFAPGAVAAIEWAFRADVRAALAVAYGALVVGTLAVGYARAENPAPWRLDAAETLGLTAYFAVVPPVLAIGVYFCLWHSLRHVARLLLVDDDAVAALRGRDPTAAFTQFARDALPLTVASLGLLAGLYVLVPNPPATVPEWVALYLVFIAVVTLPHVVVVTLMDRAQRVWA